MQLVCLSYPYPTGLHHSLLYGNIPADRQQSHQNGVYFLARILLLLHKGLGGLGCWPLQHVLVSAEQLVLE